MRAADGVMQVLGRRIVGIGGQRRGRQQDDAHLAIRNADRRHHRPRRRSAEHPSRFVAEENRKGSLS